MQLHSATPASTVTRPLRPVFRLDAPCPRPSLPLRTAADLRVGESARVALLTGEGRLCERLMALGFTRHARITRLFNAPFGDPAAYRVRGFTLALTLREAAYIRVTDDKGGEVC